MNGFLRTRELPPGAPRSFSNQAKRAANNSRGGGNYQKIEGQYDSFWPRTEKALWIGFCPDQSWTSEVYDRDEQKVILQQDQYFFSYVEHRIQRNNKRFNCSAGAGRDKPCWGCGYRNAFFDWVRDQKETLGVKPDSKPGVGGNQQHAMSLVILEPMAKVQVLDKEGKPRTTKDNKPIFRDTPITLLPPAQQQKLKAQGATTFGAAQHWSFGVLTLNELLLIDEQLKNSCSTCGEDLMVTQAHCPECAEGFQLAEDDTPLMGQDLFEMRRASYECTCGYVGPLLPAVMCACGDPKEGALAYFAIRIISEVVGEKQRQLKLVDKRLLSTFVEKYPAVGEMLKKPLELDKIFAPSHLNYQAKIMPAEFRGDGVSPEPKKNKDAAPAAEAYSFNGDEETPAAVDNDEIPY